MLRGRALAAGLALWLPSFGFASAAEAVPGTFLAQRRPGSRKSEVDRCSSAECPEGYEKQEDYSSQLFEGCRIQANASSWAVLDIEFRKLDGEKVEVGSDKECDELQSAGSHVPGLGWLLQPDSDGLVYLGIVCRDVLPLGSVAIMQRGNDVPMDLSVHGLRHGVWSPIVSRLELPPHAMRQVVPLAEASSQACCALANASNATTTTLPTVPARAPAAKRPVARAVGTPSSHIAILAAGPLLLLMAVAVRLWVQGRRGRLANRRKSHFFPPTRFFGTLTPTCRMKSRGVSVEYLIDIFPEEARALTGLADPNFHQICKVMAIGPTGLGHGKVCPRDGRPGCSIVDAIDECHSGRATHFLSWCWNYSLSDFESAIRRWIEARGDNPRFVFLWVCFFCNNQYRMIEEASQTGSEGLDSTFEGPLVETGKMLVMLDSFMKPCYITRAWCIFECFVCMHRKLSMTVILPESAERSFSEVLDSGLGLGEIREAFGQIDLQHAVASYKADEDSIKEIIRSSIGFEVVNTAAKECLMDWLTGKFQSYLRGELGRHELVFV